MREMVTKEKVERLMAELGRRAQGPGRIYLCGGASAVLKGWRTTTIDVDLKLSPEPRGVFQAIAQLKDELAINVELAAPDQFVPPAEGWEARSEVIATYGRVEFAHYDFLSQAIGKLERGHVQDLTDVRAMISTGLVRISAIKNALDNIEPRLLRYPALDQTLFRRKIVERLDALVAKAPDAA